MPASLVRLRIAGFKSFAEPGTVEILPGLTGIVGPNGCGKSNVVEALRWAMGESNARSLRGGEMDDVIFAGTASRPSRNLAEVQLTLEDAGEIAPAAFRGQAELQVTRRIERGMGSTYRVNGAEVRARDVQTLFADLASGARSSAMVSQGRVAAIVSARPEERRAVLEEAAGITGLQARRDEAETKLRAATANLARADDLRAQLAAQLASLRRQARQAERYRAVTTAARDAELDLLAITLVRAEMNRTQAAAALREAQRAVDRAVVEAAATRHDAGSAAAALPPLRSADADARAALERARVLREGAAVEAARARDALTAATARRAQAARDLMHAEQAGRDAAAAATRSAAEADRLAAEAVAHPARAGAARIEAVAASEAFRRAEVAASEAIEHAAAAAASNQSLTQLLHGVEDRAKRAAATLERLAAERDRAAGQVVDPARLAAAETEQAGAAAALAAAQAELERAERVRADTVTAATSAREALNRAEAARMRLSSEIDALADVLAVRDGKRWPPVVDSLDVPDGLEAALGAALGDGLSAAADPGAAHHWRELPDAMLPAPPDDALSSLVRGPPALARALGAVILVESDRDGDARQPDLPAGASLVSRAGAVWRWDGYTVRAGAPSAAAVRLQQRNRLAALRANWAEVERDAEAARTARGAADAAERAAQSGEQRARAARRDAEGRDERARTALNALRVQAETGAARLANLEDALSRATPEAGEAATALGDARTRRGALPDPAAVRAEADRARQAAAAARTRDQAATRAAEALSREGAAREARQAVLAAELRDQRARAADTAGRIAELAQRSALADAEHAQLQSAPDAVSERMEQAAAEQRDADSRQRAAAAALTEAAAVADAAAGAARAAEQAHAASREALVRAEGAAAQADHAWGVIAERVLERLGPDPALPPQADLSPEAEERARRTLERLGRERDAFGPVNLRAEIEVADIERAAETAEQDAAELGTAIAKLRGGIGHVNREGRERLTAVFQQVDRHFQALFTRMFGGGRAHLALVGSDDPLLAGLEIYVQPPGKRLATLSLLSGGEQALTALSLIFAVFRCNPAPVCVLDEVDAPLDDANVERFCALLDDMVQETGTRFLVVTHHGLTMARMDRLYGVTMQERGVSRLLSVDLQRAAAMAEAAE